MNAPIPGPRASRPHRAWHGRGYLGHFDSGAVVQMVTIRLGDSLPREVHQKILAEESTSDRVRLRLDKLIDEGRGSCMLRNENCAEIVRNALEHFDGERYRLLQWVIMPNHVHVLVQQSLGFPLGDVIGSWKSYTAKAIDRMKNSKGAVWAPAYYDRFIRNERHFANAVHYIENNPVKAGLAANASDWPLSSAAKHAGGTPAVPQRP